MTAVNGSYQLTVPLSVGMGYHVVSSVRLLKYYLLHFHFRNDYFLWNNLNFYIRIVAHVLLDAAIFVKLLVVIIISAVHATAGRWSPQLSPCTSILSHSHPLTATNFLDVVSLSPFGSHSYSFSFSGCPF